MELRGFKSRNATPGYIYFEGEAKPQNSWERFKRFAERTVKGELFVGLWIVLREMIKFDTHTVQYPMEKLQMSPRYRAIHKLLRLFESGHERCIGCGLCEKICIANCIKMDTKVDEKSRKLVSQYSINFGRCIFCGYCAEVCPELAIVHSDDYEQASEQRAEFGLKEDMLTPLDIFKAKKQKEFPGFGALNKDADKFVKKTPLAY
ncbi:MAG: NADH-quinone oxidoreductase subunit NuoI [Epsilonproteobacteria bacterium]|nr:NADH-quinone oxidoreductase subunit NuoI [Campylobacterota bacterium]